MSLQFRSSWIERNTYYEETTGIDPADGKVIPHFKPYDRPLIVCLCGSTRFKAAWYELNKRLTHEGIIVLGVGDLNPNHPDTNVQLDPELKAKLDWLHLRKIDLADAVLVLNVGGYVGDSTRREVLYAHRLGKTVIWLEPWDVPADLRHIAGVTPSIFAEGT